MIITKQDWILYLAFAVVTYIIAQSFEPLAFILLGSALILFAPFIVVGKYGIPFIQMRPRAAVVTALIFVTLGGLCWMLAFKMVITGYS